RVRATAKMLVVNQTISSNYFALTSISATKLLPAPIGLAQTKFSLGAIHCYKLVRKYYLNIIFKIYCI
ncbi:MAG: hypothetical protein ACYDG2_16905, partial [Ruminiclostridium sp.]